MTAKPDKEGQANAVPAVHAGPGRRKGAPTARSSPSSSRMRSSLRSGRRRGLPAWRSME